MSDFIAFGRQLLRHPLQTMALAPSSSKLCAEMARSAGPLDGPVIELGGGTGKISRALLDAGVAPRDLHTLEINPDFLALLRDRLPGVNIHNERAENLAQIGVGNVAAVVSGLPLLSMPAPIQRAIVAGAFEVLKPGGCFVQFTYGATPPVRGSIRDELGLRYDVSERVLLNLPPARVYRFSRISDAVVAA